MREFTGYMRGINLGGWLSQCDETTREYYEAFITEDDIRTISRMGFDHVRLPVDYMIIESEDGAPIEAGYAYIDRCADWTGKYGLNLLLDLHKTYGYSFDPLDKDMDREAFFHDEALQERFYRLWERIAARYADRTDRIAFELLNEIVSPNVAEAWNEIADQAIRRIRVIAPEAYVVVGGVRYNNVTSVAMLRKPLDAHVVYNFHCYEPMVFTHQKAYWVEHMPQDRTVGYPGELADYRRMSEELAPELASAIDSGQIPSIGKEMFEGLFAPALEAARENDAPLYCGEYGVIDQAPVEDALRWYADITAVFDRYKIGRAMWTYKRKDFGLVDEHYAGQANAEATALLSGKAAEELPDGECLNRDVLARLLCS